MKQQDLKRFLEKLKPSETNEYNGVPCQEWQNALSDDMYGQFKLEGKRQQAHRVAYQAFVGDIPPECDVHHKCTNSRCCEGRHLEAKTKKAHMELHRQQHQA